MGLIQAIDDALAKIEKVAVVLLFGALIAAIVVNILGRNFFKISFDILFELAPMMVLWLSLLGASMALRSGHHIKLELLLRHLPVRAKQWAEGASSLFGMVVMGLLLTASISFFKEELSIFGAKGWLSLISPIFFSLMTFRYFIHFLDVVYGGSQTAPSQ